MPSGDWTQQSRGKRQANAPSVQRKPSTMRGRLASASRSCGDGRDEGGQGCRRRCTFLGRPIHQSGGQGTDLLMSSSSNCRWSLRSSLASLLTIFRYSNIMRKSDPIRLPLRAAKNTTLRSFVTRSPLWMADLPIVPLGRLHTWAVRTLMMVTQGSLTWYRRSLTPGPSRRDTFVASVRPIGAAP